MLERLRVAATLLMIGGLGCASEHPHPQGSVVLQVTTRSPRSTGLEAPVAVRNLGDSAVVALGRDTVVVRRAAIVAREVALQPAQSGHCDPEEGEDCAVLETGPALLNLPLHERAEEVAKVRAKADAYSVFQVQIYKPDVSADPAFLASHPELGNISIWLDGTFSRAGARSDFHYVSDFNEFQELAMVPALRVLAGETVRVTLRLNLGRLFLSADKGSLIDPATANRGGPREVLMRDNVRLSLAAFRDEDHDGLDDGPTGPATEEVGGRP